MTIFIPGAFSFRKNSILFLPVLFSLLVTSSLLYAQKVGPIKITPANARQYRDSLNKKVFGTIVFPYDILPDSVVTNVNTIDHYVGFPYTSIQFPAGNLDSIDKILVSVDANTVNFPEKTKVYLFHPHVSNGKLFIYHSGHCAAVSTAEDVLGNAAGTEPGIVIPRLIEEGYTVLAVPMIYYQNPTPTGLVCGYDGHNRLFQDSLYASPLSLFFKPLIASLNQLGRNNYSDIYMCGLSGGGWTTSVYPAMDSSISVSFPVAGSWPIPVRYAFYSGGDLEQYYPPVFSQLADYHELYTLSCLAPARKMMQINNRYDACCFDGPVAHIYYVDSVARALSGSGAVFKFYLDETETGHQVSRRALDVMLGFIRNDTAFLQNKPIDSVTHGQHYQYDIKSNFSLITTPDNSRLKYALLKGPEWLTLDTLTGNLDGIVPARNVLVSPDTISFKVEDSTGRFVVYNYILIKERDAPYFFTGYENDSMIYMVPPFRNSMSVANPLISSMIYFNDPAVSVVDIGVENNSIIRLKISRTVIATDSVGYNGLLSPYALTYSSGLKLDNFDLTPVNLNAVIKKHAIPGMIRFNSETKKFEYFNGTAWIDMH